MTRDFGINRFGFRAARARRAPAARIALVVALCSIFAVTPALAADEAAKTGDLEITVTNLGSDKGVLVVALLNSAEQYDAEGQMFRANDKIAIQGGKASITFEGIPYGTYAVRTFHDANANGKLDTNFVGFPKEGFGFSNDAMGKFGPPSFEQASFAFAAEKLSIVITSK
jgi:uncharacterized protein (DUF2141 family)